MDVIERQHMRAAVVERVRDAVVTGTFAVGARLTQESVAKALSVSRMPVREAFEILEQEGLLIRMHTRHMRVAGYHKGQIAEIFSALSAFQCDRIRSGFAPDQKAAERIIVECKSSCTQNNCPRVTACELAFHALFLTGVKTPFISRYYSMLIGSHLRRLLLWAAPYRKPETVLSSLERLFRGTLSGTAGMRKALGDYCNSVLISIPQDKLEDSAQ